MKTKTQIFPQSQDVRTEASIESLECARLRRLLATGTHDYAWYQEVREITGFGKQVVREPYHIKLHWKPKWGQISVEELDEKERVHWTRPDGGPPMTNATNLPTHEKMLKHILQAMLIIELKRAGLVSYVQTNMMVSTSSGPIPFTRCSIKVNDKVVDSIVWACAILGRAEQLDRTISGKVVKLKQGLRTRLLSGHVVITVEKKNGAFF